MKYEVIIFDADETLFDFKRSERDALKKTMLKFGVDYVEDHHLKIYEEINAALWKGLEIGEITQQQLKIERFKRLSKGLKAQFDEIEFAKSYESNLSFASFLYEESIDLVKGLSIDYDLVMITNGLKNVQERRIKCSPIAKYFKSIIISEEVQVSKPDPRIFDAALVNRKELDKNKILMVGDSLSSDIQGGINYGIDTCWYNPNKKINRSAIKPTHEIVSLIELKSMLTKSI